MDEPLLPETPVTRPIKSRLLSVLCILTFIGSGINLTSGFLVSLFYDEFIAVGSDIARQFDIPGIEMILQAKPVFFWVSSLFYLMSLTGAWMMWNLKKTGFHIYTIAQILLIISPMYFFHLPGPFIFDLILSGIFIILYGTQIKRMS